MSGVNGIWRVLETNFQTDFACGQGCRHSSQVPAIQHMRSSVHGSCTVLATY